MNAEAQVNSTANAVQDRDERDRAYSRMSARLKHWLTHDSPVAFHAQACLEMEQTYGTDFTLSSLRSMIWDQSRNLYGPSYPRLKEVHYEPDDHFVDPHSPNIWAAFS